MRLRIASTIVFALGLVFASATVATATGQPSQTCLSSTAPNDAALQRRCEELTQRVINGKPGTDDDWQAAQALSHIRDPIVVPYLIRARRSQYLTDPSAVLSYRRPLPEPRW